MNIVLLIDSLGLGGAQRQIVNLAIALKSEGNNITVIRYRYDDFYLPLLKSHCIVPVTVQSTNILTRIINIRKEICRLKPDLVISFMGAPNTYACLASFGLHLWKLITNERVANINTFLGLTNKIRRRLQVKCSDLIVCNSKCAQDLWEKYFPKSKNKLKTIYNILDMPDLPPCERRDEKCRILVAARYEQEKNLSGMIRAVVTLSNEEKSKLEIHWYGRANHVINAVSEYDKGLQLIKENHLESCVFLHPATDQIYKLMAEADFIGLFSHLEGLPNSIIEGMYLHKPIIMSKVSDYQTLVDESNGYLCNPEDDSDIANVIRYAINSSLSERESMGLASREKICKLCFRDVVMQQWNALLSK
jgi:glycosyltransferase involved in cell wall biosynthesis